MSSLSGLITLAVPYSTFALIAMVIVLMLILIYTAQHAVVVMKSGAYFGASPKECHHRLSFRTVPPQCAASKMDAMRVTAAAVSCIVLLSPLCAAQNVSVGLQDAPNSVPNCRIFSQFSIGTANL